jgi:branched-chain amino acid transport system substrate-binding protein
VRAPTRGRDGLRSAEEGRRRPAAQDASGESVRRRGILRLTAALAGLALLAGACGGDDSGGSASESTTGSVAVTTATSAAASSTTAASATTTGAGAQPTSMDQWEALWADQRAAIIKRIKDNHWGKSADGKTLTGPEGFTIDLSKCPANWSDTEGLTDTEIKIGQTIPQSGTAADYGYGAVTNGLVFKYYSDKGYFKDSNGKTRKINYIVKDDGYDPARTIPLTDELIDSEHVFMQWALGTGPVLKTYDKINQRCIPDPFIQSGSPAFGDPVNHPWTIGAPQISYSTEAILWGSFIDQHINEFPDGKVKVTALVENNDFGHVYDEAFRSYIAQSPNKDKIQYDTETTEPQAPSVTDPMTTLASKNSDVFIAMVAAGVCTQTATAAAENGMHEKVKYLFQPAVCVGTGYIGKQKVGGDGSSTDGWWLVSPGLKDLNDPSQANDPFIAWARDLLQQNNIDPKSSSTYGTGLEFAWPMVQALKIAGDLPGGLSRTNLILAARSMDMTHPYYIPGIKFNLNGNKDAFPAEGGILQQWNAAKQVWENRGDVIDLSGKSKNCAWDASAGACR